MKEVNYWDRFLRTGSINDFLSYKNALQDTEEGQGEDQSVKDRSGEHIHAGVYGNHGDDFKSRTDW